MIPRAEMAAGVPDFWPAALDAVLGVVGVLLLLCLLRAVLGPRVADRVIAVNMMGSMVVILICVLALRLGESWLTDVALIYAMLSFLAVVLVTKIYIGVWRQRHHREEAPAEEKGGGGDA